MINKGSKCQETHDTCNYENSGHTRVHRSYSVCVVTAPAWATECAVALVCERRALGTLESD